MSPVFSRVAAALKESYSDLVGVLRLPLMMGLFALDCVCGVLVSLYVGIQFGAVLGVLCFLLIQSWFIYLIVERIREEDKTSKIMKEGWEGSEDTKKIVEEYLKLIKEDNE